MKLLNTLCLFLFLTASVFLLAACDQQKTDSEYYYFSHPKKLKSVFENCQSKGREYFENNVQCGEAYTVVQKFSELTRAFMQNQQAFGQEILNLQVTVAESRQALVKAKQSGDHQAAAKLVNKINQDQLTIKKLLAIVGVFVNP